MTDEPQIRAVFIGGPYDGWRALLRRTPERVQFGLGGERSPKANYERIDDPDSGEYLGGYAWVDPESVATVWDDGRSFDSFAVGRARS